MALGKRGGAVARRRSLGLSALLLIACWIALQPLLGRLPSARSDLSEDRLASLSPAAPEILAGLEGEAVIEAFLSTSSESGAVALLTRRMRDQLDELERAGRGRMRVVVSDPSRTAEALARAQRAGIEPLQQDFSSGTRTTTEQIYLGVVVRYRGAQRVFPQLMPQSLEYAVLVALDDLGRTKRRVLGWVADAALEGQLERARALLARRFEVRDLAGLESGLAVAEDVDAIVLAAPRDLHPRAAYEIERWTRAGGRLAVIADRTRFDFETKLVEPITTGFQAQLAGFGLGLSRPVVWDRELGFEVPELGYPVFPWLLLRAGEAGELGILPEHPLGAAQLGVALLLPHALKGSLQAGAPVPQPFLQSSARAFERVEDGRLELLDRLALQEAMSVLVARAEPQRFTLAATLQGELPRVTDPAAAPAAAMPGTESSNGGPAEDGLPAVEVDPRGAVVPAVARVVVFGDADWILGRNFGPPSALLLENTLDWLAAGEALIALRGKQPIPRPLRDFDAEATESLERDSVLADLNAAERRTVQRRASRARWGAIGAAFAGHLLALGLLFALHRRPRAARVELGPRADA